MYSMVEVRHPLVQSKKHLPATKEAENLVFFGLDRQHQFTIMPEKGVLEKPLVKPKIMYDEYRGEEIPQQATLLLNKVVTNFRVKQVVIGHDIVKPKQNLPSIPWGGIARLAAIVAMGTVAISVAIFLLPAVILTAVLIGGFLAGFDPCLIVVLDDGQETWVCLARWDEV